MKLILDTANISDIAYFNEYYPISGVTTNPTILAREGGDPVSLLKRIRNLIGEDKELHIQVTENDYDGIIAEAEAISDFFGKNTFVKIPATDIGIKATRYLASKGIKVTVTAVFTAGQALIAAKAGAAYVAPYVSRIENIGGDGVGCVGEIQKIFDASGCKTQILAASFKTVREVIDIAKTGAVASTVGADIMRKLLLHPMTDAAISGFSSDWENAFGKNGLLSMINGK